MALAGAGAGRCCGASFQLAPGCPLGDIVEIGGGNFNCCLEEGGGPDDGHPVTHRTVPPNKKLTHIPLDFQTSCWIFAYVRKCL